MEQVGIFDGTFFEDEVKCPLCIAKLEADTNWHLIPIFPKYEITMLGRVRNKKTKHVLKPRISDYDLPRFHLRHANGIETMRSARKM